MNCIKDTVRQSFYVKRVNGLDEQLGSLIEEKPGTYHDTTFFLTFNQEFNTETLRGEPKININAHYYAGVCQYCAKIHFATLRLSNCCSILK